MFIIFLNVIENFSENSIVLLNVRKKMHLHIKPGNWPEWNIESKQCATVIIFYILFVLVNKGEIC